MDKTCPEIEELKSKIIMNAEKLELIDSIKPASKSSLITLILPSNYCF